MLNIIPINGGYSICHDITHNGYNEQTWEFTYVLLWVPGILVIVMTKAAMFVPLDPTPPWPNQLDQCWTGPIESGTPNSWVSYVCRDEPWWVEAMCKVRYMQQPRGGRRKPVCKEGQKPGPQIQSAPWWLSILQFHLFQRTFQGCKLVAHQPNLAYRWILLDSDI